jgi:DNA adenine methylase
MWSEEELLQASSALTSAELVAGDFRETAERATAGDLVFFDPPYPRGSRDGVGFNRYASQFFLEKDHRALADIIEELTRKSVLVMLTIAGLEYLEHLYPRTMRRKLTTSKSLIAGNGSYRREVRELILTNY